MSRKSGAPWRPPGFDQDKMRNFLSRTAGTTTKAEATTLAPKASTATEGIQTRPVVASSPPLPPPPPPPPFSSEPPPPPPPESSYGQAQSHFLDPRAQPFPFLGHSQPLLSGHPQQPPRYGNHTQPAPNVSPPQPLQYGNHTQPAPIFNLLAPAPANFVPPPLPSNPYQTEYFVGPSQYGMQMQMPSVPNVQSGPSIPSNRSESKGRRKGGRRNKNCRDARPSDVSNATRAENSSGPSLNTDAQTLSSTTPPGHQNSQPAFDNTTLSATTPRKNNRDGSSKQTLSQSPKLELLVDNTIMPQPTISRSTQTEEEMFPPPPPAAAAGRSTPAGRATSVDLSALLEFPDAIYNPERAPTPILPSPTNSSPLSTPSTPMRPPPATVQASSPPAPAPAPPSPPPPPRPLYAAGSIVRFLSAVRRRRDAAHLAGEEGMRGRVESEGGARGRVERVDWNADYGCHIYFVRLLADPVKKERGVEVGVVVASERLLRRAFFEPGVAEWERE